MFPSHSNGRRAISVAGGRWTKGGQPELIGDGSVEVWMVVGGGSVWGRKGRKQGRERFVGVIARGLWGEKEE